MSRTWLKRWHKLESAYTGAFVVRARGGIATASRTDNNNLDIPKQGCVPSPQPYAGPLPPY